MIGGTVDDPSCMSGDADNASGMDDGPSAPAGACMDDAATTFDSSAYEVARAQGLTGAEAASSAVAEGDPTGIVDQWCVPAALRENHRMTRSGCAVLRELADANPNRKYYSQQLLAFAAAKPGYHLARVKSRSFATTPDAQHIFIDPAGEQYVADGGSASYNFSFGLGIKGASIGAGTNRTYATHSGRIHPWGFNPRLYHVSWMAKDSGDRIDSGIPQETGGAVLWSLPEGPAPLQGTYQVPVWTCYDPAFKVAKCYTN